MLLRYTLAFLLALPLAAQTAVLRGQVTDESGGVVPGARVTLAGPNGKVRSAAAGDDGAYAVADLPPGTYTVRAFAPGLAQREGIRVTLAAGNHTLNLLLHVAAEKQEVTVDESGRPSVSTDAAANASATVLRGADLDALSDNPDDLVVDLQALAGPSAGPNGGSIFVDGFSGGQLPPKNAIREIRINQNPFSPEYDKLGFGRIEIFTKPGTERYHGDIGYNFANDKWNSRNAYAAEKAPFRLNELRNTFSGPVGKRASFNLALVREWVDNGNVTNAVVLDAETMLPAVFTATPVSSLRRWGVTPRVDYQIAAKHTLSVRYAFNRDDVTNAGTGGLTLVSRGYHNTSPSHTVQVTETAVLGAAINETRFQYFRPDSISDANAPGFAIQVLGAFAGGGNPAGRSRDTQNNYEFQNYTSVVRAKHTWHFGARLRQTSETSVLPMNFAGTFTFSGGLAPELDAAWQPVLDASGRPVMVNITSIESYRRTLVLQQSGLPAAQIRQFGGGAAQFSINTGDPITSGRQFDAGLFAGDDWKVRPNLTLSVGLRYETQTNMQDRQDFAPRIGVAWAPAGGSGSSRPRSVIRAGFGMFYDRFALGSTLTARRFNGIAQQQYIVSNPDFFPAIPAGTALRGAAPPSTIQQVSSTLRAPYLMQSAIGFEQQLPRDTTVAITYANSHGVHMLRSVDINAPLPGTYDGSVTGSGLFPLGRPGLVVQMESTGIYNQNQVMVNVNTRMNRGISLTGSYAYNRAMSDTDGLGTFPADPYSMEGEYGPAALDIHHRVTLGGTITMKWGLRFNPLLTANSGPPFDITAGRDLFGDTLFNARPGMATDPNKPGVVRTAYGLLDPDPGPGQQILPRNYGRGPGQAMLNMRVGRTFAFGGSGERGAPSNAAAGGPPRGTPSSPFSLGGAGQGGPPSGGRRYSLTISMQIRNLTNHNNPGPIIGNIASPLFGQANQPAASGSGIFSESANNRRLELQTRLVF